MKRFLPLMCFILGLTGCNVMSSETQKESEAYTANFFAMDTYMEVTAYGSNAEDAVRAAEEEVLRLDALWSISSQEGDVVRLNATAQETVSEETRQLILRSIAIHNLTGGAFECTVLPIMDLWGFTTQTYRVPSAEELQAVLPLVDSANIEVIGNEVTLLNGTTIDLGGIAKGYTSNRMIEIFKEYGIESGMVWLGGNVQTLGCKPDGSEWRIAVQDPNLPDEFAGIVEVSDKAVITSGGYQRYFEEDGITYHHIIDPVTGYPANNGIISCTIVSEDGTLADGLSTSLFVMGLERASEFWRIHQDEFDAILITEDGTLYITEGIKKDFATQGNYLEYEIIEA